MNNESRIKEIERDISNAQNSLDQAQAELKRLKEDDGWEHGEPNGCRWLIANWDGAGHPALMTLENKAYFAKCPVFGPHPSYLTLDSLRERGWRYAKPGEVEVKW